MMCITGAYSGKCILASAACENMEMCVGENQISDCSKLEETVFNFFCYVIWCGKC